MITKTKEKIFNEMPLSHLCKGENCVFECESKYVKIDDLIKYLEDEQSWYQNEYDNEKRTEMIIQRVSEIRLLTRIILEMQKM